MKKPLPLIISGYNDPHVIAVVNQLNKEGVDYIEVNKADLISNPIVNSDNQTIIGSKNLSSITSVWYRRSLPLILPENMEKKWILWCEQEFNIAFLSVLFQLNPFWINEPFLVKRASLKPFQLYTAKKIGLKVPKYIVTSNKEMARDFVNNTCKKKAIIKCLGRPVIGELEDGVSTIFTNHCTDITEDDWERLKYSPSIFQELINKKSEIRCTIVDKEIFSTEIDISSIKDVDYRKVDPYSLPHKPYILPSNIKSLCLNLMRNFGLEFAAIDFLLDYNNQLYFTEINPSGQWYWIEELTNYPISLKLAKHLCKV